MANRAISLTLIIIALLTFSSSQSQGRPFVTMMAPNTYQPNLLGSIPMSQNSYNSDNNVRDGSIDIDHLNLYQFWPYPGARPMAFVYDPLIRRLVPLENPVIKSKSNGSWTLITDAFALELGLAQANNIIHAY